MTELRVRKRKPPTEKIIDKAIEDSFPASDPPSFGRSDRPGRPVKQPRPEDAGDKAKEAE